MNIAGQPTVTLAVGQAWNIVVDGVSAAPVVTITLPDLTTVTPDVEIDSDYVVTTYAVQYVPLLPGRYVAAVAEAGGGTDQVQAYVVNATGEPPTKDQLDAWLGGAGAHSWSDDDLAQALGVALTQQRRVCRVPVAYPDDLFWAALRRAARHLYMKRQLTDQPRSEGGDFDLPAAYPPGRDQGIRELEAPYRKLVIG